MNVMTSRSRRFCIINGNASALQGHATWQMLFAHAEDKCAFVDAGTKTFATVWAETEADDALKARVYQQHAALRATLAQPRIDDEQEKPDPDDDEEKKDPDDEESKDETLPDAKRKRRDSPKSGHGRKKRLGAAQGKSAPTVRRT